MSLVFVSQGSSESLENIFCAVSSTLIKHPQQKYFLEEKPMGISFEDMSVEAIQDLQNKAVKHLELRKKHNIGRLKKQIKDMVKAEGLELNDIFPTLKDEPYIATVEPKYRNPENYEETWTGRGRTPRWLQQKVNEGASREDFLID